MEQVKIDTLEKLATYARQKRRDLDVLLRGGFLTLPPSRYVSLGCTQMEFARGWLGKLLGSLPENPHPYPESLNPGSTVVAPATDRATPEETARFWASDESTPDSRIRRLRRALADLTLDLRSASDDMTMIEHITTSSNGLHAWPCLDQCIMLLHEASMSLGFELESIATLRKELEDFRNAPITPINHESADLKPDFNAKNLSYSTALAVMKNGYAVARAGWNGKNMFIYLNKGSVDFDALRDPSGVGHHNLPPSDYIEGIPADLFERGGQGTVTRLPNLNMHAATSSTVTGWLASQTDQLAEDWHVMPGMYFGGSVAMGPG